MYLRVFVPLDVLELHDGVDGQAGGVVAGAERTVVAVHLASIIYSRTRRVIMSSGIVDGLGRFQLKWPFFSYCFHV